MRRFCRLLCLGLALLCPVAAGGDDPEPLSALPELLRSARSQDPAVRLDARRRIKLRVGRHYSALAPEGMRYIPGALRLSGDRIEITGGFYLAVHEVTRGEYAQFERQRRTAAGEGVGGPEDPAARSEAIGEVSLESARAYAAWAGARLPTAEELAIAARGPARYRFPWGETFESWRVNSRESGVGGPRAPGSFSGGASFHGIEDLLGNLAEWTESTNGKEGERLRHLVVGGSYRSHVRRCRFVTYRLRPPEWQSDVGFRLARDLPPLPPLSPRGS